MNRVLGLLLVLWPLSLHAQGYEALVSSVTPKVVQIEVDGIEVVERIKTDGVTKSTYTERVPVGWGGSGSFISADGFILTCDHLFSHELENQRITVRTSANHTFTALLLKEDPKHDLALLKIFTLSPTAYFSVGKNLIKGQAVLSFGSPLLIQKTVSYGYVQNLDVTDHKLIMHSASINPGNSGGPLVNERGELVGVNVQVNMVNMFSRAEGLNEAVRTHDVRVFLEE